MRNTKELRILKQALREWEVKIVQIEDEISMRASMYVEEYFLSHSMQLADALIAAKRTFFGEFAVAPDAGLSDVTAFYELEAPLSLAHLTVAEAFHIRHGDKLRAGSRLTLGSLAELVARSVEDGQLTKASLRIDDIVGANMQAKEEPVPNNLLAKLRSVLAGR